MPSKSPAIQFAVDKGIARIVFCRPEQGNRIDDPLIEALDAVTLECSEHDDIRALVIASSSTSRFSMGGDIRGMIADRAALPANIRRWNASLQGSLTRLQRMRAPSVIAIGGVVAGGALSLAASCDIVVASSSARFVAAYASIGYCADMGGSSAVTRRMGLARARRFYLLHEQLDAQAAQLGGLVDFTVPEGELIKTAEEIAERWASGPTLAYGEIRRVLQTASETPYETQMELETQSLAKLARSDDAWEGLNAFIEKRAPRFFGR